ncbi:PIN domain-containing protein [Candidatus Woesearchaeota archaeon]|nr:PIN domain-containing protein [Candidatus Woesearchaeota archaeon]
MVSRYYLDACIWLDLIEDRNEPHLSRGDYAWKLLKKIISEEGVILYSDMIVEELTEGYGYPMYKIEPLFQLLKRVLFYIDSTEEYIGKAKEIGGKRNIPHGDVLHALLARDYRAQLVSRDRDFEKLKDIVISKKPEELI